MHALSNRGADDDSMRWYLRNIGKQRLLSPEEVNKLSMAIQQLLRWDEARVRLFLTNSTEQ